MFSSIRKFVKKVLCLLTPFKRIRSLEKRVTELENISDERESLWLFIEEMQEQERAVYRVLQDELNEAIVRSICLLYTSPSPRDRQKSRMPSSA